MTWDGRERRRYVRTPKPPCPKCFSRDSNVVDSDVEYIDCPEDVYPRQRQCKDCCHKWFTFERNANLTTTSGSATR
jgi:transcriptional regulator NrdR family protein